VSSDYQHRADVYRPTDAVRLGREIRRQARRGYQPRDIAAMLRISESVVLEALASEPELASQ